jgi:hypothetical protein
MSNWKEDVSLRITRETRANFKIVSALKGQPIREMLEEVSTKLKKQYVGRIQKNEQVANVSK